MNADERKWVAGLIYLESVLSARICVHLRFENESVEK